MLIMSHLEIPASGCFLCLTASLGSLWQNKVETVYAGPDLGLDKLFIARLCSQVAPLSVSLGFV